MLRISIENGRIYAGSAADRAKKAENSTPKP
jgi:hypothetical protein